MQPVLTVHNIEKYYGGKGNLTKALDHVSFQVHKGEFMSIMGASGSGKTTLLNCIATIDHVSSGNICLNQTDITTLKESDLARFRRENLGFIFQDYNLLDTLTVEENIALALTINGVPEADITRRVTDLAGRIGIRSELPKFPAQISGGEKQRCACARAVIHEPQLILADEPTGALDSKSSQTLLEILSNLNQKMSATILMVTHDPLSASYSERILFLKDGHIFNELFKGDKTGQQFYHEILDVLAVLGGERRC